MRTALVLVPLLLLGSCSCQRDQDLPSPPATASVPGDQPVVVDTDAGDDSQNGPGAAPRAAAPTSRAAVNMVHRYVSTVLNEPERAGEFWAGGNLPPHPDDAALYAMRGIRNLRIDNDAGIALDQESPAQALEIPVRVRVATAEGTVQLRGWYRVRSRLGSDEWEITSASLHPVLQ